MPQLHTHIEFCQPKGNQRATQNISTSTMTKNDSKRVIPLESNPAVFTDLAYNLGLTPVLEFHDVYSLTDKDLLNFYLIHFML